MFNAAKKRLLKSKTRDEKNSSSLLELSPQAMDLAAKVLIFCNQATDANGIKLFSLFGEIDPLEQKSREDKFKNGLCFGLSHMFLFCSFITDMQDSSKKTAASEQDIEWFKRCIGLLNKPHESLNQTEKGELVEFCSMVMHIHNHKNLAHLGRSIFEEKPKAPSLEGKLPFLSDEQYNHVFNIQFTGQHELQFEPKMGERYDNDSSPVLHGLFATQPGPLYATISLITSENTHCVSLYKNKDGKCTFYDPERGFFPVSLNNLNDVIEFKKWMHDESTIPLLGKPELGFDVLIMKPAPADKSTLHQKGMQM